MLTHVVLMKFTDPGDASHAEHLLAGLPGQIPEISALTVKRDELRTPVSYDLCLITEHDTAEHLRAYQEHRAHLQVAQWLRPRLAARAVVDFQT